MYTLLHDGYEYTVIDFNNALWFNNGVWQPLADLFLSPILLSYYADFGKIPMSNYSNIEDWIQAVTAVPSFINPVVICHFDSLETFTQDYPEYFI